MQDMGEGYRCRPYYAKCTGSHPNSEVKWREAGLVLRWGTARETPVMTAFFIFCFFVHASYLINENAFLTILPLFLIFGLINEK